MIVHIRGTDEERKEVKAKFGDRHVYMTDLADARVVPPHIIFDFVSPQKPESLSQYERFGGMIFIDSSVIPLAHSMVNFPALHNRVIGFCGLKGFINRDILEVTTISNDESLVAKVCKLLGTEYRLVADQAGMVSPRMICMIINEAYFTLAEGTASREDIDLAMKLGTNYPAGPFEWGKKIGLANVVKVLWAAKEETGDNRYAVCPLLEQEAQSKV